MFPPHPYGILYRCHTQIFGENLWKYLAKIRLIKMLAILFRQFQELN